MMYSAQDFTRNLYGDLLGGVTAAVVALPLALAFGIASGAGAVCGLYGAIIIGLFAAIFGGTPSQISGPTGPMTVVMTAMIASAVAKYPEHGLALAFTTVFLGGCLQILFGLLRLGKYIVMVPYPVVSGFMSGIGIIIIVLQLAPILGFAAEGNVVQALVVLPRQLQSLDPKSLLIGATAFCLMLFWRGKVNRLFPSPLLGLIIATLLAQWIDPSAGIARIGEIPSALPTLNWPTFRADMLQEMLLNALMLAALGSIDSLLTALVADNVTGKQHHSDRELIGQGIGNALCGLLGGLPGAGATMRTIVNIRAGGSGPLSGATHALVLLMIVSGTGFLFTSIPLAALAGLLIKVGVDIIDWPLIKRLQILPRFTVFLMTIVLLLTIFVDLVTGVFVGVFIKNIVTLSKLSDLQLGSIVLSDGTEGTERLPGSEQEFLNQHRGEAVLLRITGPVSYAAGRGLKLQFEPFKLHKLVVIDIKDASLVGTSTVLVLEDIIQKVLAHQGRVTLIGALQPQHRDLKQLGLIQMVGSGNCVNDITQVALNIQT